MRVGDMGLGAVSVGMGVIHRQLSLGDNTPDRYTRRLPHIPTRGI
jgi:hypothetical protein